MTSSLRILGLTIHVKHEVLCYSTPSALNNKWDLKWGPIVHSPWAVTAGHIANIFTGSLINSMPFHFSWLCFLLSITLWMHIACICEHRVLTVLRAVEQQTRPLAGVLQRRRHPGPLLPTQTPTTGVTRRANPPRPYHKACAMDTNDTLANAVAAFPIVSSLGILETRQPGPCLVEPPR